MSRRGTLGFDRRIDLEWLDAAAAKASTSASTEDVRAYIWEFLEGEVSGNVHGSARQKTTTVLHHIWGDVPDQAKPLRGRALVELKACSADERLALHWAMALATYSLFSDTASAVGRLLMLQGQLTLAHLTRRLVSTWGERSTLTRAAQRVVRSMAQWGVLHETGAKGLYKATSKTRKVGPAVGIILIEALLIDAEEKAIQLEQLTGHPALFPFSIEVNARHVRSAAQFRVHRQGLDSDLVELS
jgi:hypothetical protein